MRNKIVRVASLAFLSLAALSLIGCQNDKNSDSTNPVIPETGTQNPDVPEIPEKYFPVSKMNAEKHLRVLGSDYGQDKEGRHRAITAQAFQGLMNRKEVNYYLRYEIEKDGLKTGTYWLEQLEKEYQMTHEEMSFEEMIMEYKAIYGDNAGYILYDDTVDAAVGEDYTRSITAATNMAAIRGWLPVTKALEEEIKGYGLEMKLDVTDKDEKWVFDNYKDEFDNSILVQQRPIEIAGYPMVPLRDYSIANKYFMFYEAGTSASDIAFRSEVHTWAKPNRPILGWGPGDEGGHIGFASQFGQFPIPSDFSTNLTVFNADLFAGEGIKQKNEFKPITPEAGKHYIAFGRSDGDNISVWQNYFPLSNTDFRASHNAKFPMSWSIQPSMYDIAPAIYNIVYNQAGANDYFIAPVSGHGYIYPSTYPEANWEEWFGRMDEYLGKTDLSVCEILDLGQGDIINKKIANQYASAKNLKGGIVLNGDRYAGGQGAVVWSDNGKPFIAPRETLWTEQKEMIAARINSYHRDYTRIEGYTFVNLHPWSHSYQDVEWVVDNLDENVVVVSPEQLIDLISKNVPKKDVTTLEKSDVPVTVPFDPLNNKFLLDAEDWKGDAKQADNMLTISNSANKTYTLPDIEDLTIEFQYKSKGEDGSMKVEMEIDGVKKTIADAVQIRKAEGINSFFIPLASYFNEFKNKEAKLTITANTPIAIDNVITAARPSNDATSNNDKLHDDFSTGLEDWVGTCYEKGANIKAEPNNKRVLVDGSDGWTGLFNNNINTSLFKTFTMPNANQTRFVLNLNASDYGTDVKVQLVIDGKVINLTDGFIYLDGFKKLEINKVLSGFAGKNAILTILQKDSNKNVGAGELFFLAGLKVDAYEINPEKNGFDIDLEDWEIADGTITHTPGFVVFENNSILRKNYTFNKLGNFLDQTFNFKFTEISAGMKCKVVLYDGEVKLFESALADCTENTQIIIEKSDRFVGKTLRAELVIEGTGKVSLDEFTTGTKANMNPYDNKFLDSMEDWKFEAATGWENNKVQKDPSWPRLQFTYALNGSASATKAYKMLNTKFVKMTFDLEGQGDNGGMLKLEMMIGENTYELYNKMLPKGRQTVEIDLYQVPALKKVAYANKNVTLRATVTQVEGGAGDGWMWGCKTEAYDPDSTNNPYVDIFTEGVEDWTTISQKGWADGNAFKWDQPWKRMQITYANIDDASINGMVVGQKTYTLPNSRDIMLEAKFEGQNDGGHMKWELVIGENAYTVLDEDIVQGIKTIRIELAQIEALNNVQYEGQEVSLRLSFEKTGAAADAWIWGFETITL